MGEEKTERQKNFSQLHRANSTWGTTLWPMQMNEGEEEKKEVKKIRSEIKAAAEPF